MTLQNNCLVSRLGIRTAILVAVIGLFALSAMAGKFNPRTPRALPVQYSGPTTVVPVIIESGNSGNYGNVKQAQYTEANLGAPGGNLYYYLGDEDITVSGVGRLWNGAFTFDDRASVSAAHIVVAGDAQSNPSVLYVFVAMQTDSGIGIRHALAPLGYYLTLFNFTGVGSLGGTTVAAGYQSQILAAAAANQLQVNVAGSEVGAGTVIDVQSRFLNGTFTTPGGASYTFTETSPLLFADGGSGSTKSLALTPTTGLAPAYPFSFDAQPVVIIMKTHSASQTLSPTNPNDNVKRGLDATCNITSLELSRIFSGFYKYWGEVGSFVRGLRTLGLSQVNFDEALAVANATPIAAFQREPISGTYLTFEECLMQGKGRSQEYLFNLPATSRPGRGNNVGDPRLTGRVDTGATTAGSPYSPPAVLPANGGRVAGDGRMLIAVKNVDYSIGYTFWNTPKFAQNGATSDTSSAIDGNYVHYLMVDGVDPLAKSPFDSNPKFGSNFANPGYSDVFGSYPIWADIQLIFRAINPDNNTTPQEQRALSFRSRYAGLAGAFLPKTNNLWLRSFRSDAFTTSPQNGTLTLFTAGNEDGGEIILKARDMVNGEYTGLHQP
ncbi:MAG: hypothetical protein WCO51_08830 [bacterium]